MSTKTIYQVCWRRHITSQAINVIVWSPKRQNIYYPDLRLKSWGGFLFFFCFSACQLLYILKQLPISHKVQLRFAKALHRCVPLIDVAIRICLVSSSPRYLFIAWGSEGQLLRMLLEPARTICYCSTIIRFCLLFLVKIDSIVVMLLGHFLLFYFFALLK